MIKEVFKFIPKYENIYSISNLGKIYSYHRNRLLKGSLNNSGYLEVNLWDNTSNKYWRQGVHRLVYMTFKELITTKYLIHHKDDNKLNNNILNLEKINRSIHKKIHSTIGTKTRFKPKYNFDPALIILKYEYLSTYQIAKEYGCDQKTIERLIKKHTGLLHNRFKHMINNRVKT